MRVRTHAKRTHARTHGTDLRYPPVHRCRPNCCPTSRPYKPARTLAFIASCICLPVANGPPLRAPLRRLEPSSPIPIALISATYSHVQATRSAHLHDGCWAELAQPSPYGSTCGTFTHLAHSHMWHIHMLLMDGCFTQMNGSALVNATTKVQQRPKIEPHALCDASSGGQSATD